MVNKNEEKKVHSEDRDNVIPFPKPSTPSRSSSEENVGSGEGYTINFVPDWDGWGDDPEDSSA